MHCVSMKLDTSVVVSDGFPIVAEVSVSVAVVTATGSTVTVTVALVEEI